MGSKPIRKIAPRKISPQSMHELKPPVPHYRQSTEDYACGPACICMALDCLLVRMGKPKLDHVGIKEIERLTMDNKIWSSLGTSHRRMKHAIRRLGFGCKEIHGRTDQAREDELRRAIGSGHPVILGCMADIDGDRYRHYIVLTRIDDKYLYICDPYPKGRPAKVLIENFRKNGSSTSWGNKRWGIEVYISPTNP